MDKAKKKKEINSFIIFRMLNESFAINVSKVLNILEMQKITKVPEAPPYMLGVINLRGEVLPVIDSHIKFGAEPIEITYQTCILVLDIVSSKEVTTKLGLMVDFVDEVIEIKPDTVLPPPGIGETYQSKYITGMYQKKNKDFIMMLDIDKLLSINEIIELNVSKEVDEKEQTTEIEKEPEDETEN